MLSAFTKNDHTIFATATTKVIVLKLNAKYLSELPLL